MFPPALPPALSTLHTQTTRTDRGDNSLQRDDGLHICYASKFDSDRITIVLDSAVFDWHIGAEQGYSSSQMAALLDHLYDMGYEPLPEDECGAEILDSGGVRIYLVPVG